MLRIPGICEWSIAAELGAATERAAGVERAALLAPCPVIAAWPAWLAAWLAAGADADREGAAAGWIMPAWSMAAAPWPDAVERPPCPAAPTDIREWSIPAIPAALPAARIRRPGRNGLRVGRLAVREVTMAALFLRGWWAVALRGLPITFPSTTGVARPMTGGVVANPARRQLVRSAAG